MVQPTGYADGLYVGNKRERCEGWLQDFWPEKLEGWICYSEIGKTVGSARFWEEIRNSDLYILNLRCPIDIQVVATKHLGNSRVGCRLIGTWMLFKTLRFDEIRKRDKSIGWALDCDDI